ncbi:sestrin homolog isoform X2 [Schistocerca gregaria]|uniref:sestrin homolog isoform X2 n=1 Tax=Schistocerca gregaria TaxID=7010 RepID=UPI00211E021F|nr:sestrin homolog isoform X2 [Schistocerca gregaria]
MNIRYLEDEGAEIKGSNRHIDSDEAGQMVSPSSSWEKNYTYCGYDRNGDDFYGADSLNLGHSTVTLDEEDDSAIDVNSEVWGSDSSLRRYFSIQNQWGKLYTSEKVSRKIMLDSMIKLLNTILESDLDLFMQFLPKILYFSVESPFSDIEHALKEFLEVKGEVFKRANILIPEVSKPSRYFEDQILPIETTIEPQASVFKEVFLTAGRVTHLDRILAWYPTYWVDSVASFNYIMRADGPLPHYIRNYIAILASSQFRCYYLVMQQEQEFLNNRGSPEWLKSTENLPPKLRNLLEVNAILAHQPWLIEPRHITNLICPEAPVSRWSMAELVHAFVIMATFRTLSIIALAMGVNLEFDLLMNAKANPEYLTVEPGPEAEIADDQQNGRACQLAQDLSSSERKGLGPEAVDGTTPSHYSEEHRVASQKGSVEKSKRPDAGSSNESKPSQENWGGLKKYLGSHTMEYRDFDVHSKDYSIFHIQDYNWEEQGYELLQHYYGGASLLDKQFTTVAELKDQPIDELLDDCADLAPIRRSVWHYAQRLQGLLQDDYNYAEVNSVMGIRLKTFVKHLVCMPYNLIEQKELICNFNLSPKKKCYLVLLAAEARKKSELIYAFHAITKNMALREGGI